MSACFSQLGCFNIPLAGRHCFIQPINEWHSISSYVVGGCVIQRGRWNFLECACRCDEQGSCRMLSHGTVVKLYPALHNLDCASSETLPNRLRYPNKVYKLLVFQNSIEDMFFFKKFFISLQFYVFSFCFMNLLANLT